MMIHDCYFQIHPHIPPLGGAVVVIVWWIWLLIKATIVAKNITLNHHSHPHPHPT
jgi:hypothetical protein